MSNLLRGESLNRAFPVSKSRRHALIKAGEFPPPIKIGPRASAYIEEEVAAVVGARAVGLGSKAIATLVSELVAARIHPDAPARRAAALKRALGKR